MKVDAEAPAGVLKVLGEPVRWRIVELLADEDLCVCHLVDELALPQPLVSHHLRALRRAGLVTTEPCGSFTYYLLDRAALASVSDALRRVGSGARRHVHRRPCQ